MECIKIEKRPRDDPTDIVNNDNCKIPHLEPGNRASWNRIWNELSNIVETLVSVHGNNISEKEINDLLMIISSDPDKLTFFDVEYGSQNVEIAIKKSSKVLYPDGIIDENLSNFLWIIRDELMLSLRISNLTKKSVCSAWCGIKTVSAALHTSNVFNIPQYQRKLFETQESKLLILMSVDPDMLRNDELSLEIGQSKSEIGILQCKHILERVKKSCRQNTEFQVFQNKRNKKILLHNRMYLRKQTINYDDTFKKVRIIVEKFWNEKCEQQLDALTVLFIMEPKLVHSKFLFSTIHNDKCLANIEDEVRVCLKQPIDKKINSNNTNDNKSIVDTGLVSPIISHLELPLTAKRMKRLRKKLRQKIKHELPPKILDFSGKYIVCSNTGAFEWLATTLRTRNEIWNTEFSITISQRQYIRVAMLSQLRLRKPFSFYMEVIKEQYPNLNTELWIFLESESDWMTYVRMDINSIAELEQRKRCIQVNEYILKFEMFYAP